MCASSVLESDLKKGLFFNLAMKGEESEDVKISQKKFHIQYFYIWEIFYLTGKFLFASSATVTFNFFLPSRF